ncbi:MAG: M23 family metallopeptidase [Bacilli bacterium]|nr:M23 family metallopeptidase [Bacilli bacterium]
MSKQLKAIPFIVSGVLLLSVLFVTGFTSKSKDEIQNVFQVYLDGSEVGIVNSKEELENYIDKQQSILKNKFKVDTVYAPKGLDIRPYRTFGNKVQKVDEIYNKINNKQPFTVKGFVITIKSEEKDLTLYTLDKKVFTNAMEKSISTFVDAEQYQLYLDNNQVQIKDTGSIIENVELEEDITIKEDLISVDNDIFLNQEDLTKYLLFGTTEKQATYTVKAGDTISQVAFDNKLSPEEFLIANPEFTDENNLLFQGQEVVIGLINPQFSLIVEKHVVEDQVKSYQTEIKYDNTVTIGTNYTLQKGEDGLDRITKKEKYVNGELVTVVGVTTQNLKPSINEIQVKGGKVIPTVGDTGSWGWPTIQGYTISSNYGWRWGRLHAGVDIAGTGHGSPIFASNNGVVTKAGYHSTLGNYVYINHNNGYHTAYGHMSKINVSVGQTVARGQTIGLMGNTGRSTGTHLHFEIWTGGAPYQGGTSHNPLPYLRGQK